MATEAEQPMRLAPASSSVRSCARVRMPPEALMPHRAPATPRSRATSAGDGAARCRSGRGLDEIRAGLDGDLRGAQFFFHREQGSFERDLEHRAVMMGHTDHRANGVLHGGVVAALELADGQHHVEFAHAQADERDRFLAQRGDERTAEGRSDDGANGNAGAVKRADRDRTPTRDSP